MSRAGRARGVAGLVAGFGIGQGAMFLAQTRLIIAGHIDVVGQIGLALAGLSLAQLMTDYGGTFIMSRHAAREGATSYVVSANLFRALVGILVTISLLVLAYTLAAPLERSVLIGGSVAIALWSINLTGVLDGIGRTAVSGPISSLSWLLAAGGLFFFDLNRPETSAFLVGGLFSIGAVITVSLHYVIAHRARFQIFGARPTIGQMREFAREGWYYVLANIPGQLYGRSLILIAKVFLGVEMAGAVVYARNLVTAATQGLTFIRRVEFPGLVRRFSESRLDTRSMLGAQWWSIGGSAIYLLAVILTLILIPGVVGGSGAEDIPAALLCLSIPIPIWAISSSFQQAFLAVGDTRIYAIVGNIGLLVATIVILGSIRFLGIFALLWGEIAKYGFEAIIYHLHYKSTLGAVVNESYGTEMAK